MAGPSAGIITKGVKMAHPRRWGTKGEHGGKRCMPRRASTAVVSAVPRQG